MNHTGYPAYALTTASFANQLPEHWDKIKVSHAFDVIGSGTTPESGNESFYGGDIPWVTTSELRETSISSTEKNLTCNALAKYSALKRYNPGAVVIAMYGATIGRLGILETTATVNQACCVFDQSADLNSKYFYYWLMSSRTEIVQLAVGGGQPNLGQDDLKRLYVPAPSLREQQTIARFLDYRTAQLDRLIEKKRQLLDKLAEKRSALITRAVTRGLDPDAPMKDSGVPWLGEIPAHWRMKRLKHAVRKIIDTEHKTAPSEPEGDYLVVRTQNIRNGKLLLEDLKFTGEKSFIAWTRRGLPEAGDILFTREAPAGEACMVPSRTKLCIGQRVVLLKADRARWDSVYLMSSLYAGLADEFIQKISVGSTVVHFNMRDIGSIPVLMPPKNEQEKISERISSIRSNFESSESTLNKTVKKLAEYRSALITAAVTGQIDVRDWQPPEASAS